MAKYEIDFSYEELRFGTFEVDASDEDDARTIFEREIGAVYPEAEDIVIDGIRVAD